MKKNKEKKISPLAQTMKEMRILSNAVVDISNRLGVLEEAIHHLLSTLNKSLNGIDVNAK
jgi:hypothetical protein